MRVRDIWAEPEPDNASKIENLAGQWRRGLGVSQIDPDPAGRILHKEIGSNGVVIGDDAAHVHGDIARRGSFEMTNLTNGG
jgi:hypothetical protein